MLRRPSNFRASDVKLQLRGFPTRTESILMTPNAERPVGDMRRPADFRTEPPKARADAKPLPTEPQEPVVKELKEVMNKMLRIEVDDPEDRQWLGIKQRRLQAGETEAEVNADPPLGRPQRKTMRQVNFATANLPVSDQLQRIDRAIATMGADTKAETAVIKAGIHSLIASKTMTLEQLTKIGKQTLKLTGGVLQLPGDDRALYDHRSYLDNMIEIWQYIAARCVAENIPVKFPVRLLDKRVHLQNIGSELKKKWVDPDTNVEYIQVLNLKDMEIVRMLPDSYKLAVGTIQG